MVKEAGGPERWLMNLNSKTERDIMNDPMSFDLINTRYKGGSR